MAEVTTPPVLISAAQLSREKGANPYGFLWRFGSDWYQLLGPSGGPPYLQMFKSSDDGATWTEQDAGNRPGIGAGLYSTTFASADASNIAVAYTNSFGNAARIKLFDPATDTWQVTSADSPADLMEDFRYVRTAAASYVFYRPQTGSNQPYYFQRYAGGAWDAAPVLITPLTGQHFQLGVQANSAGVITFLYATRAAGVDTISAVEISGTTVSAPVVVFVGSAGIQYNSIFGVTAASSADVLLFPYTRTTAGVGAPACFAKSAAGTWSHTTIDLTTITPSIILSNNPMAFAHGATLYVFWAAWQPGAGGDPNTLYYASSADGITWSAPTTYYDAIANPPPAPNIIPPDQDYIHDFSAAWSADDAIFVSSAFEYTEDGFTTLCVGYMLLGAAPVPPPTPTDRPTPAPHGDGPPPPLMNVCPPRASGRRTYRPWKPATRSFRPCK